MKKHAYLIMAHNQFELLKKLIKELDHELNDIYIHIDKKVKSINEEEYKNCVKMSKLYFVDRKPVTWGGESLIDCEIRLFQAASVRHYQYYHLLSGVDYPIKTQTQIHKFFDENEGKEFVEYWDRPLKQYKYRVKYYYPFQEKIGTYTYDFKTLCLRILSKGWVVLQWIFRIDRSKKYCGEIKIGSNWVSVTDSFVEYLLSQEDIIRKTFMQGVAADELFVQSVCWNSKFRENIYEGEPTRLVDWKRGQPYTWKESDINDIKLSNCLFLRKVTNQNRLSDLIHNEICEEKDV